MPAWLDGVGRDARFALRGLLRRPGFSSAAVATLALGIGASTAIFSVAYGVSLRPLPYPHSDRLIRIYEANPANGALQHDVSFGAFHAWRDGARAIESIAVFSPVAPRTLAGLGGPRVIMMSVSPAFFDVLGARPLLGPGFKAEREYTRETLREVVLSNRTWRQLFAGRRDVIGQTVALAGYGAGGLDRYTVVGVMPEDFAFTEPVDLWMPTVWEAPLAFRLRAYRSEHVLARLKPNATIDAARSELAAIAARMARETPTASAGWTVTVASLHDSIVGDFARATWLLLAAVAVVLLTACLNVGGLLAARAIARERETAVRVSLGAGPWLLFRFWLAEALLLGSAGAVLGMLLAWLGVTALKAAAPPGIPRLDAITIDAPTLVVALASMLLAVAFFAAAPLREARRSTSGHRSPPTARTALTAAQCAGAATLVILAVMLSRSFLRLISVDLGWRPQRIVSLKVEPRTPPENRRPWFARVEWTDRLMAGLESTPGIERAVITTRLPLGGPPYHATLGRGRGKTDSDDARWPAIQQKVTDRFFELMGIRVIDGRVFGRDDRFNEKQMTDSDARPDEGVAIVTAHTARTLWPGESAIGRAIWFPNDDNVKWRRVVGIVDDIQFNAVGEAPELQVFEPWTQDSAGQVFLMVKATSSATAIAGVARDIARKVAPGADVDQIVALDSLFERATAQPRFTSRVVAAFGALALALAAVGIYG
ncbi:MAG TPA: ABC transporter permease, partial [Vicinamibacterales bacterium]|nr:ABC transporter permease [Vicinamibacterales bacterium]